MRVQKAPDAFIVTVIKEPAKETTVADVIIGSLGIAGLLVLLALVPRRDCRGGALSLNRRAGERPPAADYSDDYRASGSGVIPSSMSSRTATPVAPFG